MNRWWAAARIAGPLAAMCLSAAAASAADAPASAASPLPPPASSASAPVASSPAKRALIAKLLALQQPGIEVIARTLAEQPLARIVQGASQALQTRVPPDKRETTAKAIDAEVRIYLDDAVPLLRDRATKLAPEVLAPALETKFSEDELRQIVNWLESPTYKKYQQAAPELQNSLVEKVVADNRAAMTPKLKALDDRIAAVLRNASQPSPASSSVAPGPAASAAAPPPAASKAKP